MRHFVKLGLFHGLFATTVGAFLIMPSMILGPAYIILRVLAAVSVRHVYVVNK